MTTTCNNCHEPLDPESRFCGHCGQANSAASIDDQTVVSATLARTSVANATAIQAAIQRAETAFGATAGAATQALHGSSCPQHEQMILCCDVSPSMSDDYDGKTMKLDALSRAGVNLILNKYRIDPDDEIGIVTFSGSAQSVQPAIPTRDGKQQLIQTIQSLTISGWGTSLKAGLERADSELAWSRSNTVRRVVLITDGHGGKPFKIADALKGRGAVIDVIGIGSSPREVNEKVLKRVASVIEGELRYRFVRDSATLIAHYTGLATKTATAAI